MAVALFEQNKQKILSNISSGIDFSPKGNIDGPVLGLVNCINMLPNYVTTSSCSGRISCYYSSSTKGIEWIFVKHRTIHFDELNQLLESLKPADERLLMVKCEPAILHVLCKDLQSANKLHQLAFSCGYRESGIGMSKKIMVAIRTTAFSLEVPILLGTQPLLTKEGLQVLVQECNTRLLQNFSRIQKLLETLKKSYGWPTLTPSLPKTNITISKCVKDENNVNELINFNFSSLEEVYSLGLQHFAITTWKHSNKLAQLTFFLLSGGRKSLEVPLPCIWCLAIPSASTSASSSSALINFTQSGDIPCSRWGHSLCQFDSRRMLLIGGRNLDRTFNDAYFLEISPLSSHEHIQFIWTKILSFPQPLFFHAACYLGETQGVFISGGLSSLNDIDGDITSVGCPSYVLLKRRGSIIHSNIPTRENVLSEDIVEETTTILPRLQWITVDSPNATSRFGHTITSIGAQTLIVIGGASFDPLPLEPTNLIELWDLHYNLQLHLSSLQTLSESPPPLINISVRYIPLNSVEWRLGFGGRSNHQTLLFEHRMHIFGGNLRCEALFGSSQVSSVEIDLQSTTNNVSQEFEHTTSAITTTMNNPEINLSYSRPALLAPIHQTKLIKSFLESHQWLDKSRRINSPSPNDLGEVFEVEMSKNNVISDMITMMDLSGDSNIIANWKAIPITINLLSLMKSDFPSSFNTIFTELQSKIGDGDSTLTLYLFDEQHSNPSKVISISNHRKAAEYLQSLIPTITRTHFPNNSELQSNLQTRLEMDVPTKFEFVGNVIMLPEDSLLHPEWETATCFPIIFQTLLDIFNESSKLKGNNKKYNRIARKAQIDPGPMRESRVKILYSLISSSSTATSSLESSLSTPAPATPTPIPLLLQESPGWVELVENKIRYGFDITKVMFCSGNVTERMRMSTFVNSRIKYETIVDLYAGIGYYTLPFLLGAAAAKRVHACEWNPNSIAALEYNLIQAGIDTIILDTPPQSFEGINERCIIHRGDNQISASRDGPLFHIADRVCLGLLPSSVSGWPLAVNVLKHSGGIFHVHENVRDIDINKWVEDCISTFVKLFAESDLQLEEREGSGKGENKPMSVVCTHIERVKSFSPHVLHIVVDLFCTRA